MNKLIKPFGAGMNEMHDESLYTNIATSHSSPKNEKELIQIIKSCISSNEKITVCGSLTGLVGGAVAHHCHSLSTVNLKAKHYNKESNTVEIESGATFEELEKFVLKESKSKREFPISPTEKTATIGGAISCNSSGLRSYHFGKIENFIESITYCNSKGQVEKISKNDDDFQAFIGSEGMMGIIIKAELKTIEKSASAWGIMFFFKCNDDASSFVDSAADCKGIQVIEYIDKQSFQLCESYKGLITNIEGIPPIPNGQSCGIYLEIYADTELKIEEYAEHLMELSMSFNSDPDLTWAMSYDEMSKLQIYRHAISECINMEVKKYNNIESRIKFINIDIKWNNASRKEILQYYLNLFKESKLNSYIYGHIGSFNLYVNIVCKTNEEYTEAEAIVQKAYKEAINNGNEILFEFGVGKLRNQLYCNIERVEVINKKMKAKQKYDLKGIFNPMNIFII